MENQVQQKNLCNICYSGDEFVDIRKNGKVNDWTGKKKQNVKVAELYQKLGYDKKATRVGQCAEILVFELMSDDTKHLINAGFCKDRLCPICNWRRAMKHSHQVVQVIDEVIKRQPGGRFLFLTLTTKNTFDGEELKEELTRMAQGFNTLMRYTKVKKNMIGYLKSTEVTVNPKDGSYNQHIHVLVYVKSTYFKNSDNYISQDELTQLWKKAMKLDYTPIVNMKAVKNKYSNLEEDYKSAVYEVAKYPVKSVDYLTADEDENMRRVRALSEGLKRKRLIVYGGLFKDVRKEMQLEDVETGELIDTDDSKKDEVYSLGRTIMARWNWERQKYYVI